MTCGFSSKCLPAVDKTAALVCSQDPVRRKDWQWKGKTFIESEFRKPQNTIFNCGDSSIFECTTGCDLTTT